MKQLLRHTFTWLFAFSFITGNAQTQQQATSSTAQHNQPCHGVPGACGGSGTHNILAAAHTGPVVTPQNGNGTLGNSYNFSKCGLNFTQASQRLGQRFSPAGVAQPAPFTISGIPTCAVIEKAFLWAEGSGNGTAQTATVAGPLGTANYPMSIIGSGPDKCWSYSGSYTYRADVTPSVSGNGTYNISGLLTSNVTSGNDMDGATLMVIYSDPTAAYRGTLIIDDGAIVNNTGGSVSYNMNYAAVCGATTGAQAFCCLGDIQMAVTSLTLNGTSAPIAWNWWNYVQTATTVAAGQTTSNFFINTPSDCYNLCVVGLYYRTTSCTTCPTSTALTLTTTSTNPSCTGCNGTATVNVVSGGSPPYTYSWSTTPVQTTQTATGLCAGTYTVTVTANGGCLTNTAVVTLTSSGGGLTVSSGGQTNVSCNGLCNGSATVTASGGTPPYTYSWNTTPVQTTPTATNLCPGNYTCTVTSSNGCTGTLSFTITQPPVLTASSSSTPISCAGGCNGTATATGSGGTPTYTYSWNTTPVQNTQTATGLCAGTYVCTITDSRGCTTTQTVTLTAPPALTSTQAHTNVTCNGLCNGTATATPSGGSPGYTYSWNTTPVQTTQTATGLCAGTYVCTITDSHLCTTTQTVTITQPAAFTSSQTSTNIMCNGVCNGSASMTTSGGNGSPTYSWNTTPVQTTSSISGLCAGTYIGTATDASGCTTTQTVTITQPTALTATTSSTPISCSTGCNGTATATASGGTAPYSYSWNTTPVQNTQTATGLCGGTYVCTITDSHTCTITQTVTLTAPSTLTSTQSHTDVTCNGACNGTGTATASGGTGPYAYSWNTTPVQTTQTATGLCAGTYICTITDAQLCTTTQTVTITQPAAFTSSQSSTNILCNGACTGTATITGSGGTGSPTYSWNTTPAQTTSTATALCAGTYIGTATDGNGCTSTQTVTITQPPALTSSQTHTDVTCNAACNGTATVSSAGGTGTPTYSWNTTPAQTTATASNLCAGVFICTVTDGNGCTSSQTVTITQPTALALSATTVSSTCGSANGSIDLTVTGGTTPYSYSWNTTPVQTTEDLTNILAGTYIVTVTDFANCTATLSVTVSNMGSPTITITSQTDVTCFNACDGTINTSTSGGTAPYAYSWNTTPVQTTPNASALCAGTYIVTVTDANNCTAQGTATISQPTQLQATIAGTDVSCFGACDGTASVTATGGTAPYTYNWAPAGGSGPSASGLCAMTYTCTITDANNCTTTITITITEPTALALSTAGFSATCNGSCDGQVVVIPSGGTQPYSYLWSSGCTNPSCNNMCAGIDTITVTDAHGCTIQDTAMVTQPTAITATSSAVSAHCNQPDGSATVNPSGGTGSYSYSWNTTPVQTTQTATNIQPGTYICTITDANLCSLAVSVTVPNIPGVQLVASGQTDVTCNGLCDGTANVSALSGTQPYTYNWNTTPAQTTPNATALCAGSFICTVTDSAGCTASVTVTITQPTPLTVAVATPPWPSICLGQSTNLQATPGGGTIPYVVAWNPGSLAGNSPSVSPTATTTYTVTVTDQNNCTATATETITVNPIPAAALAADVTAGCVPLCVNFADLSTVGAPDNIASWVWDFGDGSPTSNAQSPSHCYTVPGVYTITLTVTSNNGCTNTIVMANYINVYPVPTADFSASPQPATILNPQIFFTDLSVGATQWNWSFGDVANSSSSLQNPSFVYGDSGCYNVYLIVNNADNCFDTTDQIICIAPEYALYIPNAFTPNGDGVNDFFIPKGMGINPDDFEMWIFDRWGNMIYYTDDLLHGWDGHANGGNDFAQIDTYVYKIKCKDVLENKHDYIGRVTLVK